MFGLELGTIIILLLNAVGLVAFIARAEQLTKTNAQELASLQRHIEKLEDTLNLFKLEAAHKYASQESMKQIKDEIAFEIRRLGDRLDKVFDLFQSKGNRES